jgi:hypothetical protein
MARIDPEMKESLLGEIRSLLRSRTADRLHAPESGNAEESEGGEGPGVPMEGEEDSDAPVSQEPLEEEQVDSEEKSVPCAYCGEGVEDGAAFCGSCGRQLGGGSRRLTKSARFGGDEAEE